MVSKTRQAPPQWASMRGEVLKLVPITSSNPTTADEYRTVSKQMQDTMYNKTIVSIQRVQNVKLWEFYAV